MDDPSEAKPLDGANLPWKDWLHTYFPQVCTHPFAPRHERLWKWFDTLDETRPQAHVEVWPREGGKSTTSELGVARVCAKLSRRYALYVSGTQDQANKHVQSIATLLERLPDCKRSVNIYGHSKGWRHQELRTAHGFNCAAIGLDAAIRGAKLDQYRPDLIVFDDIDSHDDSLETVEKKIETITTAILPAGSQNVAILFLQNRIHSESILSQLVEGRANFLHDREPAYEEPAVLDLTYETVPTDSGLNVYRITGGTPTWEGGQSLAVCEQQLNSWGERAFRREAQHEVQVTEGYVFNVGAFQTVMPADLPALEKIVLAWDLAATEGGGSHTAGCLMARGTDGRYYVLAILRGQWSSERVRACIDLAVKTYTPLYGDFKLRLPQDPGQAGKDQKERFGIQFQDAHPQINPVTGSKATRASNYAEAVNLANVSLLCEDIPECFAPYIPDARRFAVWHLRYREELRKFRDTVKAQQADQVDASSDSFNLIARPQGVSYGPQVWS